MRKTLFWSRALVLTLAVPAFAGQAAPAKTAQSKAPASVVNLNTASQSDLEALPGVGPATAKKIIAGRPYASVADLAKAGVPKNTIDKITPMVTVGAAPGAPAAAPPAKRAPAAAAPASAPASVVNLNTASESDLVALPGVGPATAKKIMAGRPYASVADLSKAGVPKNTIEKITPMVTVGAASAPAAPPPPKPAPAAPAPTPAPAAATTARTPSAPTTAQQPPVKGMVWVNIPTKIYHREGDRFYGNTKNGKFMTEEDAIKAGYREAKTEKKKTP